MKSVFITKNEITIALSPDELAFLISSIGETLEAVREWEFQTRTGQSPSFAKEAQKKLNTIWEQVSAL